ncbi:extracellular solute-binding protein [Haloarcula salina]|uniref:extracellular solute-binding protein n=1 Tax=Haloarcula salina TaxID=1429914 RepID=UPI003C6FAF43
MPHGKRTHQSTRRRFIEAVGVAGAVGLAGCGGTSGSGGDGEAAGDAGGGSGMELSYHTLFVGGDGSVMKSIVEEFNETQPVGDVTISRQRSPWEEYYNQLFTSMAGGNAPDLAISHATYIPRFQDTLVDISDYTTTTDGYVEKIFSACQLDGGLYALPMDTHPVGLYINQDILDQVDAEPPFEDFAEFEATCNAIRDETDALPFGPSPVDGLSVREWYTSVSSMGGSMFTEDNSEAVFDQGAGLDAAKYYHSVSGERNWDRADTSEERVLQSFLNGSVAMMVNGTWGVADMADVEFNWNFAPPRITPNADRLRAATDSHTLVVPTQPDGTDERYQKAVEAAQWITQKNPEWGTKAGHVPAWNPILEGDQLQSSDLWDQTLKYYTDMAQNGQLAYFPQLANADFYDASNWNWIRQLYGHQLGPEEAVSKGVETWNSNL